MFFKLRFRNKPNQLGRYEHKLIDRVMELREVRDEDVIAAIKSVPTHYVVGPQLATTGTSPSPRQTYTGGTVVSQEGGKLAELSLRGQLFSACDQGSGVAPGTSLSTTAMLSLYNPAGSGRRLVLKRAAVVYTSGTLGTGILFHCQNYATGQTAPSSGTALTCNQLGAGGLGGTVAQAKTGSTVVAPVAIYPMAYLAPELATSVTAPQLIDQDIDGAFVVEGGMSYQMQAVAAGGSTPKLSPGIIWADVSYLP